MTAGTFPARRDARAAPLPARSRASASIVVILAMVCSQRVLRRPPGVPARKRMDLEVLLTQRWGVWLGAAALLLAAVFLVRTAVEQGWLGPAPRCALAVLLGAALIGCAEWLRRRPSQPAALTDLAPGA